MNVKCWLEWSIKELAALQRALHAGARQDLQGSSRLGDIQACDSVIYNLVYHRVARGLVAVTVCGRLGSSARVSTIKVTKGRERGRESWW